MTREELELLTDIRDFHLSIVFDFEIRVLGMVRVIYREQVVKREYATWLLLMIRENRIFISVISDPLFFLFLNRATDPRCMTLLCEKKACM